MRPPLNWQQDALKKRNRIAAEQLGGTEYYSSSNGLHVWMPLPQYWGEKAFVDCDRNNGVAAAPGAFFSTNELTGPPAVRICLGVVAENDLIVGLRIVRRTLQDKPESAIPTL